MPGKQKTNARSVRLLIATALAVGLLSVAVVASAQKADTEPPLRHMQVNLNDTAALRSGAMYFTHQCAACHSLQGARYSDLAAPLELSREQIQSRINISGRSVLETIATPMPAALAKSYFGVVPPDLTVEVRRRGVDWLYTYLTSFYVDPSRPTGANNVVFHNVAMPNVFAGLQGLQKPVTKSGYRNGHEATIAVGVKPLTQGSMTPAQFDQVARNLVTFLYYVAYPHEQLSHAIGFWILIATAVWIILAYLVYRLFWRDVVKPHGPRWWSYWKR